MRPLARGNGSWSVQVGSYAEKKTAESLAGKLRNKGYDAYVMATQVRGKSWHRVLISRLASPGEAKALFMTS